MLRILCIQPYAATTGPEASLYYDNDVCDMTRLIYKMMNNMHILYKSNVKIGGLCKTSASLVASVERHILSELNDGILCCAGVSSRSY